MFICQSYKKIEIITGILLCVLFTLISFVISNANSPPLMMKGSTAFPINSDYIILEKETIKIKYGVDKHSVEVVFHFHNTGPETDLKIGFPNVANYGESLYDFKAFQYPDKIEYEVEEKPGGLMPGFDQYMYEKMYSWTMHFNEGERKALLVTYQFYNTTMGENDFGSAGYILKTGALWKDNIESIDVLVEFPEKAAYHEIEASPSGYFYNGSGIEWNFENIEPDFDLDISYNKLPDNLKFDWMYEPKYNIPVSDYIWNEKIFVVDLFERWNLEEEFYFNAHKTNAEIKKEAKNLYENCMLVKNEILARHGVKLSDEWHDFFSQFPWYNPQNDFSLHMFNETEKLNLELIQSYQEHIFPDADAETINKGMNDLYEKYGDAFFRYYPVFNRLETKEYIQSFINQRINGLSEYKPLHLGQASPGYVKAPAVLNKVDDAKLENTQNHGQTVSGYSILETTDSRFLLKKENAYYEIYKRTMPVIMYERRHEIPLNSAFIMNLEFHDYEMGDIIKKWCKEVKDPETGETLNLIDVLLILPEEGEKYVLTGFNIYNFYNENNAWSEDYNYLAYMVDMDGAPFLQVFDIKNRYLKRYRLPESGDLQEIVVLNDGSGFFRLKDTIYNFSPRYDYIPQLDLKGQIIDFDHERKSLLYINQQKIYQYSMESGRSFVLNLPEDIWKIEKQDQNNYLLYCHPEYYYIFNMPNQTIYRYPQVMGYSNVLIFSPSGFHRLEQFSDNPPLLTKGNTDEPDNTYKPKELNLPATHRYEWLTDRELIVTEYLNVSDSANLLILEHIYDVEKEVKLYTRSANKTYTEGVVTYVKDGCYFHGSKPVLANAIITDINAFPGSIFTENPDYKSGVPVGILETNGVSSKVVYYYPWGSRIYTYDVDNKYLELTGESEDLNVGFIIDAVVYVDAAKQDILLEKCSTFVTTSMKSNNRIKIKIANALEGWVDQEALVPGFVSADKIQITSLPDDPVTETTSDTQPEPTDTLITEADEQDEAIEAMKTVPGDWKNISKGVIYIVAAFLILVAAGVYLSIREKRKQREK